MYRLNSFDFTVHTTEQTFKTELFKLIDELLLIDVRLNKSEKIYLYKLNISNLLKNECDPIWVKKIHEDMKNEGNDFFSLQIIDEHHYKFSFQRIAELNKFEDSPKVNKTDDYDSIIHIYNTIYSHENVKKMKAIVVKQLIGLIKNKNLLSNATINNMSYICYIDIGSESDSKNRNNFNEHALVRLQESTTNGLSYTKYEADSSVNKYTHPIKSYKSYISYPQKIVDHYLRSKNKDIVDIDMISEINVIKYLEKMIKKKFDHTSMVQIKRDNIGRYYVEADENCRTSWQTTVKITDDIDLEFIPVFASNQNHFGLCVIRDTHNINLYGCEGKITSQEYKKLEDKTKVTIFEGEIARYSKHKAPKIEKITAYHMKLDNMKFTMHNKYVAICEVNNWTKENSHTGFTLGNLSEIATYLYKEMSQCILVRKKNCWVDANKDIDSEAIDYIQNIIQDYSIENIEDFQAQYINETNYIRTDASILENELISLFYGS